MQAIILAKEVISNFIKKIISNSLIGNFISLVTLQGVNYLLPLLVIPFLFNRLGVDYYGLVNFTIAFSQYFIMFTEFGFGLSGTRYIANNRDDHRKINNYLNSALLSRSILSIVSFVIYVALIYTIPSFREEKLFVLLFFGQVIGNVISPYWFFQGMEKMKFITILTIVSKLVSITPLFFLVHSKNDICIIPILYSAGSILGGIICMYLIAKKFKMKYYFTSIREVWHVSTDSCNYFLSRISVSLFTNTNTFIIGLVLGNTAVGYYALADKAYQALNGIYQPLISTIFPYMTNNRNKSFFKKIFSITNLINLIVILFVSIFAKELLNLIFHNVNEYCIKTLQILMFASLVSLPNTLIGYPYLAAFGHPNFTNLSLIASSLIHISGVLFLLLIGEVSLYTIAWMVVITETFLLCYRSWGIYKYKLSFI